ncbi:MAG: hypothetical protein II167_01210 [Clostridiales bacterium]|nr:hypothetical protein [Clostridiales bacterium]
MRSADIRSAMMRAMTARVLRTPNSRLRSLY